MGTREVTRSVGSRGEVHVGSRGEVQCARGLGEVPCSSVLWRFVRCVGVFCLCFTCGCETIAVEHTAQCCAGNTLSCMLVAIQSFMVLFNGVRQ